ncbi:MAG: proprotein convertase P-domain-containing protein [Deltaproteobacteria bacterium]|nr:proprotein convertase P-domain-containing protein [Deltaproteobacteria bacterium]
MKKKENIFVKLALLAVAAMLLGACGGSAEKKNIAASPSYPTLDFSQDLPYSGSLELQEKQVYQITGISEGLPLSFTLGGMTDNADLRIFGDSRLSTLLCGSMQMGTLEETCPVVSTSTSVYIEITDQSAAGNAYTLSGQFNGPVLTYGVDTPYAGTAAQGEVQFYQLDGLPPDAFINISLTGLTNNADLQVFSNGGFTSLVCSSENPDVQDELCIVTTPGTSVFLRAVNMAVGSVNYTLDAVLNPAPSSYFTYGVSSWMVSSTVSLNGSPSSDPGGESITLNWSLTAPSGSTAALDDSTSPTPTFVADVHGVYTVTLAANDGHQDGIFSRDIFIAPTPLFFSSIDIFYPIWPPDPGTAYGTMNVSGAPTSISAVTVYVNVLTGYDSGVLLRLISPLGTSITLTNGCGTWGVNYTNTIFSDFGNAPICSSTAPFTGVYTPLESLSVFQGEDANGTWQIQVTDLFASYSVMLTKFEMHIE